MKIQKRELNRLIGKLKGIVTRNEAFPAIQGILVTEGMFIASNTEITIQAKSEAYDGEKLVIPMESFELIQNLPDEEVEIKSEERNRISISTETIHNNFSSYSADEFSHWHQEQTVADSDTSFRMDGDVLMRLLGHVVFAADEKSAKPVFSGVHFKAESGILRVQATDGHMVATDSAEIAYTDSFEAIIPKTAVKKILSVGFVGETEVRNNKTSIQFANKDSSLYTRIIAGDYPDLSGVFNSDPPIRVNLDRKEMLQAVTRANYCSDSDKPIILDIQDSECTISVASMKSSYTEKIHLQATAFTEPLQIGFGPKLLTESLKAFDGYTLRAGFSAERAPMTLHMDESNLRVMILPVLIR